VHGHEPHYRRDAEFEDAYRRSMSNRGVGLGVKTIPTLSPQPAHLIHQPAVLDAKRGCLTTRARQLLSEDWEDRAKVLQAIEQMIAVGSLNRTVDRPDPGTIAPEQSGATVRAG
jgi:hypothetical protein